MKINLTNCRECGAVIQHDENQGLCRTCALRRVEHLEAVYRALDKLDEDDLSLEKLADASGLSLEIVKQLLRRTSVLRRDLERKGPRLCARCRKPMQEDANLCLSCRLFLFERLRTAHEELEHKADKRRKQQRGWLPPDEQRHTSVVETLNTKRANAPLGKLDPSPKSRFRS
ncbi:MAG: hypothetical protein R6V12_09455 [Candidatus Hydrogenedentota bacterium]